MEIKYARPGDLEPHPLNLELVPEMAPEEFEALVEDVREKGVLQPLEVQKGTNLILDGRNRWKAAIKAGLEEIPYREVDISEEEVPLYILERVPVHRNLTKAQKAALAAEYALKLQKNCNSLQKKLKNLLPFKSENIHIRSAKNCTSEDGSLDLQPSTGRVRSLSAQRFGINHQYVQIALNLKKYAPESFELLKRGEISLQEAQGILTRARIEKEAADRLIPELLELIDRADLDPAVVWEICFMSEEGQRWLVRTIEHAGLDVAQEFAELTPRDMKEVRLSVEEILNHPAVLKELEKKQKEIDNLQRQIQDYQRKQQEISSNVVYLEKEREKLLARIRELEEQPVVSEVETEEYLELQDRLEEMERKIEELEIEKGRLEMDAYSAQSAYEEIFKRYKELEAKVKEQEEYIVRLKEAFRKKKKRKSWVDELKAQHKREIDKFKRKLEKQRDKCEQLREGVQILTKILTGREQVKKRKKLVKELYEIAGHLKAEDLHQKLFDAVVDPYTEKSSIFGAFEQVVEGLEALTETFSKACKVAMEFKKQGGDKEGGEDEATSSKVVRLEEARAAASGRDFHET